MYKIIIFAACLSIAANASKIALLGDNGKYLSRCNLCNNGVDRDIAFVHVNKVSGNVWAQWIVKYLNDGKISL